MDFHATNNMLAVVGKTQDQTLIYPELLIDPGSLVITSMFPLIVVYDLNQKFKPLWSRVFDLAINCEFTAVAFSPDGNQIVVHTQVNGDGLGLFS